MQMMFKNVRCWDPESGYSVCAPELGPIDRTKVQSSDQYVQVGPYRIKVTIESNSIAADGEAVIKLDSNQGLKALASSSGEMFFQVDNVERMSMDGSVSVLGTARGCFDISW